MSVTLLHFRACGESVHMVCGDDADSEPERYPRVT
jgi:hypothetical protein